MSLSELIRDFFVGNLNWRVDALITEVRNMAINTQAILDEVRAQSTKIASINTLMDNMRQQILDRIAEGQAAEAAVNDAFNQMRSNTTALDEAIAENTQGGNTGGGGVEPEPIP